MTSFDGINVPVVLASLKGFQRRSVDYVFERLYGEDSTRRFLLADEAGLGKTLVARGVIAKTIEHLRACGEKRIDIVYICSNADIARQNISRLNVTGKPDFQLATRITLLPQTVSGLAENPLNFSSFTPGTSFDLGHSPGQGEELQGGGAPGGYRCESCRQTHISESVPQAVPAVCPESETCPSR